MRILFATSHAYLPQIVGGAEVSTHVMCQELIKRHHDVAVLAELRANGFFGLRSRLHRRLSGTNFSSDRVLGYPVFRGWGLDEHLFEIIARFKPDGLIVTMLSAESVPLATAAASTGLPTLAYVRNTRLKGSTIEFPQGAHVKFVANSDFTRKFLSEEFGVDADVVPPIIVPESYRTNTDRSHVTFVNPHPVKGGDIAVSAAAHLPEIPFCFIESWPLGEDIKSKYQCTLSACRNVTWLPPTSDMRRIYAHTKFVIMPSQFEETWGRVATEAQVSAIPVIASQIGGLPESVGPGGVLLPPTASSNDWASAIKTLWENNGEYDMLSQRATAHSERVEIQPDYLIENVIRLLHALSDSAKL